MQRSKKCISPLSGVEYMRVRRAEWPYPTKVEDIGEVKGLLVAYNLDDVLDILGGDAAAKLHIKSRYFAECCYP